PEPRLAKSQRRAEEADLVLVVGEARAQRVPPRARRGRGVCQADETLADRLADEVLLGDAEPARVPAISHLALDAHHEPIVDQEWGERRERLVENRLDPSLIQVLGRGENRVLPAAHP